jgi:hypothetical protein
LECRELQSARNTVIHQGLNSSAEEAETAMQVAVAVFEMIVRPMLYSLDLEARDKGRIEAV